MADDKVVKPDNALPGAPKPDNALPRGGKVFRLKAGVGPHYNEGKPVEPGGAVSLSESQAAAFADKFDSA